MADVLGTASAVAGLVSLSGTILAEGYAFIASVIKAPQELKELLAEVAALGAVLGQLQDLLDDGMPFELKKSRLQDLAQAGLIEDCRESLAGLNASISQCRQIAGQSVRNFGRRMVWPFKEKETKETIARLARIRGSLAASITVDIAYTVRDIHAITDGTASVITEFRRESALHDAMTDRKALFKWLNPKSIDVDENLIEGLKHHHPGTGQWLLDSVEYHSWSSQSSSILWIQGIPGSGKTVLASFIVNKLRTEVDGAVGVVYFFCDHRDFDKQALINFVSTAVVQLLYQHPILEPIAMDAFRGPDSRTRTALKVDEYVDLFIKLARTLSHISIVIDALDECKGIRDFADCLRQLSKSQATIRILTTSRYEPVLENTIGPLAKHRIPLEQKIDRDIHAFVTDEVESRVKARTLKVRSSDLRALIVKTLTSRADGMFIWVSFQLNIISELTNDKAIREALYKLPDGLEATYEQLLKQAKQRHKSNIELLATALKWIVSSRAPMKLSQLVEAISIEPTDTRRDLDKIMSDDRDLLKILGSLIVLDPAQRDPVISLVHFSLYEYLESDGLRIHDSLSVFHVPALFLNSIAAICAQYLSFADFEQPCRSLQELGDRRSSYKFLNFAANNWLTHIVGKTSFEAISGRIKWFIVPCRHGNHFLSWQQVFHDNAFDHESNDERIEPLHYAVEYNMVYLFKDILNNGGSAKILLQEGYTPLHLAVIKGSETGVATVLGTNPDLEIPAFHGQTALHLAAAYGNLEVVKLLLSAGASPSAQSNSRSTPLYRAARSGSVPTLECLRDAGSDINAKTWDAWTPIFEAIENFHVDAVRWLVSNGANLHQRLRDNPRYPSVLDFARTVGNQEIVEIIKTALLKERR
ncbi:hypothetical protein TruAng_003997 [Truncatella angustata]|nr:hypothetical protein TruAng_003997 [Truncatella angustata]